MSHSAWLFISLIISMVVILFLILKVKLNAAISLVLGSILMGALSGVSLVETIDGINVGFGNMLKGMGLPIGFGIILGELVSRSGGMNHCLKNCKSIPKNKGYLCHWSGCFYSRHSSIFRCNICDFNSYWHCSHERNQQIHCPYCRRNHHRCCRCPHNGASYSGSFSCR